MGTLLRSFTYERNIVGAELQDSADKVLDILGKVAVGSTFTDKVETNILSAAASYLALVRNAQLTPMGKFVLRFAKLDPLMAYQWVLTRALDRYQFPNGTASRNNATFQNAGVTVKPLKMITSICHRIALLDPNHPVLTFKELFEVLDDDANWSRDYEELAEIIVKGRAANPVSLILGNASNYTLLAHLEPTYGVPRDNWNGFLIKTLKQTGLFEYHGDPICAIAINSKLTNHERTWLSHIMGNDRVWNSATKGWDEYMAETENELPRTAWMTVPPPIVPFLAHLQAKTLNYDYRTVKRYVASLATTGFVVLAGNSGTGKSSLSSELADHLGATSLPRHAFVEVGSNWNTGQPVIGYWDSLAVPNPTYRSSEVLNVALNAEQATNEKVPHFITLDEMNLSHVEWYFSDFLSILERAPNHRFVKYAKDGSPGSGAVKLGKNVYITGTLNVDHTTKPFSPKVLDRAHVIEIPTKDPATFGSSYFGPAPVLTPAVQQQLTDKLSDYLVRPRPREGAQQLATTSWGKEAVRILSEVWKLLEPIGFDFGDRITVHALLYLQAARELSREAGESDWTGDLGKMAQLALDEVIVQKVLTKIHGQKGVLDEVLRNLEEYLSRELDVLSRDENLSARKIARMRRSLRAGYASFFGS